MLEQLKKMFSKDLVEGYEYIYFQFSDKIPKFIGKYIGIEQQREHMFDYSYNHVFDNNGDKTSFECRLFNPDCIRALPSDFDFEKVIQFLSVEQVKNEEATPLKLSVLSEDIERIVNSGLHIIVIPD